MRRNTFSGLDYWRLADELSIVDASFLTLNLDPGHFRLLQPTDPSNSEIIQVAGWSDSQIERAGEADDGTPLVNPAQFRAVFKALRNAVFANKVQVRVVNIARHAPVDYGQYGNPRLPEDPDEDTRNYGFTLSRGIPTLYSNADPITDLSCSPADRLMYILREPDWFNTTIEVEELKSWFLSRGTAFPFFFPEGVADGFRDKQHVRYAAKLATAVAAWEAVERPSRNKSVKQSLTDWVISNGVSYGLGNSDGIVTATVAEEIAKIANWHTSGGATPTYTEETEPDVGYEEAIQNFEKVNDNDGEQYQSTRDLDDEIPF
jgi:hypothetical protein